MMMRSVIGAVSAMCLPASAGFTIEYDGTEPPSNLGLDFIVFGGTSWDTAGGSLNLTTAPVRGIWMGAFQSNPFVPQANDAGTYLKLDVKMGDGAKEWSASVIDGTHSASFGFDDDVFSYSTASARVLIPMDLTAGFTTFEFLLKDGLVSYRVDGVVLANRVAAAENTQPPIMLIGDGSGSTPTGEGSMSIDNVVYTAGPDFDAIPTPGVAGVLAAAGLVAGRRRR